MKSELPNPFTFADGRPVNSTSDWNLRRAELHELVVGIEYGGLPPRPESIESELLHQTAAPHVPGATHAQYRITCGAERPFSFVLKLWIPPGEGPFPVAL